MAFSTKLKNALTFALGVEGGVNETELETAVGGGSVTGDVLITNSASVVQATKLAAATLAAIKTDVGTKTLLAAVATDRQVIVTVNVTTAFATGDGAQPTLALGQTSATTKFAATSIFVTAAAGATFTFGGTLTGGTALLATQVAGTGTTETGAYTITAIAVG